MLLLLPAAGPAELGAGAGPGVSVVAVARQPVDVGFRPDDYRRFLTRLAMAVNGRFPPGTGRAWRFGTTGGLALGLTVVGADPGADRAGTMRSWVGPGRRLATMQRARSVPLGVLRVNLGQEALSFALAAGPAGVFAEPALLADALCSTSAGSCR